MSAALEDARPVPRRIGVVEDHPVIVDGIRGNLAPFPDLEIVASAPTVQALISITDDLALVVLDLHGLPDGSRPADNIRALHAAGIGNVLVYTYGERRDLVQEAARAGALAVIGKTEPGEVLAAAINAAANGEAVGSMDWAAAIDADSQFRPRLSPRERQTLELYASGESGPDVAKLMNISLYTMRENVKRIKDKYASVGRPAHTKSDLRRLAREDGLL